MNSFRFPSQLCQGRGEYSRFRSQSSQSREWVPKIRQGEVLAIEACILVAELSKLTKLRYVSKGGGREWFPYMFQTRRFLVRYWPLQGHQEVPKLLRFRHILSRGSGTSVSCDRFDP